MVSLCLFNPAPSLGGYDEGSGSCQAHKGYEATDAQPVSSKGSDDKGYEPDKEVTY